MTMYEINMPEIQMILRETGKRIGDSLPKGWGFALLLFEYEGDALFYISSADREGVLITIEEWINKMRNDPIHRDSPPVP